MAEVIYAGDGGLFKICTKCSRPLGFLCYTKSKRGKLGLRGDCKECHAKVKADARTANLEEHRLKGREKYHKNPEKARAASARWRAENLADALKREAEYRDRNREILRQKDRERIARDPERHRKKTEDFRRRNPGRYVEAEKRWRSENREKLREKASRSLLTPQGRINNSVRSAVHKGLTRGGKNGRRTFEALGYSLYELMKHLERQFLNGMSWDNYGKWHIDHIRPVTGFKYETVDDADFKACWALTNLRPLWAIDNLQKKNKRLLLV